MAFKSLVEKMVDFLERAAFKLGCDQAALARFLARRGRSRILPFLHRKKRLMAREEGEEQEDEDEEVWRRTIMMGEKCQPLEFSGAIYYDGDGKRVANAPRSPLGGKLPQSLLYSI